MATDLTVVLEDRPGTLAQLGEALGQAGINIDAACGIPCAGEGAIHLLVEDAAAARNVLVGAGIKVAGERTVLLVSVVDKPGELGMLARRIASAGVNIDLFYLTTGGQIVFGVDDLEKARAAL